MRPRPRVCSGDGCTKCPKCERNKNRGIKTGPATRTDPLSKRMDGLAPSVTLAVTQNANALQKQINAGDVTEFGGSAAGEPA